MELAYGFSLFWMLDTFLQSLRRLSITSQQSLAMLGYAYCHVLRLNPHSDARQAGKVKKTSVLLRQAGMVIWWLGGVWAEVGERTPGGGLAEGILRSCEL